MYTSFIAARRLRRIGSTMKELHKTLIFVAVALLLTGAAFVGPGTGRPVTRLSTTRGSRSSPTSRTRWPAPTWRWSTMTRRPPPPRGSRSSSRTASGSSPRTTTILPTPRTAWPRPRPAVMDLTKDTIRSDRVEDQEEIGVIDPLDTKATSLKGRGKRVTLRDSPRRSWPTSSSARRSRTARPAQSAYVRVPGQKRTYGVNVKADLSTQFADWIETNLLKLEPAKVRTVKFDNYKVDLEQGVPAAATSLTIERKDSSGPWTMSGLSAGPGAEHREDHEPDHGPGRPEDRRRPPQARRALHGT